MGTYLLDSLVVAVFTATWNSLNADVWASSVFETQSLPNNGAAMSEIVKQKVETKTKRLTTRSYETKPKIQPNRLKTRSWMNLYSTCHSKSRRFWMTLPLLLALPLRGKVRFAAPPPRVRSLRDRLATSHAEKHRVRENIKLGARKLQIPDPHLIRHTFSSEYECPVLNTDMDPKP